jgi:CBS domain containing-hemolysin-like protein
LSKTGFFSRLIKKNKKGTEEINLEKRDMIQGILDLSETTVKEIQIPRIDVEFVSVDMNIDELLDRVTSFGHSRFPAYKDTIDNVIGILYAKDLLSSMAKKTPINIEKIIRKPYFVPESKRLDDLLREFKRRKVHIAVAVDEYGGISGIVCLEDILEEIVGDIQDEFDNEREDILEISKGVHLVDARINIEDLNEQLTLQIPVSDFDTLGGFVFDLFGKIPVKYEKTSYGNLDFIIQAMDGHKIETVKIVQKAEGTGEKSI